MKKLLWFLSLVIFANIIFAQSISYNELFQVNTYTNSYQLMPSTCGLVNGGFVICWESYDQDGSQYGIYAQIYDENGTKVGDEFQVNTYTYLDQTSPSTCSLAKGGFVICWESIQDGSEYGIYAQIYDENGTKVGNEFQVNTHTKYWQVSPSTCGLTNGGFVISWESYDQDGSEYGIYAQIYDENGTKVGDEFQVNTYTNSNQLSSSTCGLTNGGFVICWESDEQDGSTTGIYIQIYDENGTKVGDEFQANTYTNSAQNIPSTCGLSNGGFVVCWESYKKDGSGFGISAQIYNENGTKVGDESQVNTHTYLDQTSPSTCSLTNGGFVICWESYQDGSEYGIYAQIYDENGTKVGNEFLVNTFTNLYPFSPGICDLTNGGFVICWQSDSEDGNSDIFGKYYLKEPINHILSDFNLIYPANDETISEVNVNFKWDQTSHIHKNFPWELNYDLYIDKDKNFANPIINYGIQDTTYQIDSLTASQTYFWKVLAKNISGDSLWSSNINGFYIDSNTTDVKEIISEIPDEFKLFQNYPNPFNPTTTISYTIANVEKHSHASVQIKVFDILGREVSTLVNKVQTPGTYQVKFDGSNLPSGIYFYKLQSGNFVRINKMIFLK